jgi:hypothetical protein
MRLYRLLIGVAVCVAGFSRDASAQKVLDFGIQCTIVPFRACMSLQLSSVFYAALNQTEVRFRIANMQGRRGFDGPPTGIKGINIQGWAGETHDADDMWSFHSGAEGGATANSLLDLPEVRGRSNPVLAQSLEYDSFVYGCDVPEAFIASGEAYLGDHYDRTCGGAVIWSSVISGSSFKLNKNITATVYWHEWDATGTHVLRGTSCTTGVDCAHVTPEPVSMVLLATGLVGVAATRLRRRKRWS